MFKINRKKYRNKIERDAGERKYFQKMIREMSDGPRLSH